MKRIFVAAALAAAALVPAACNKSNEGGTPGTDNAFHLEGGTVPNAIKQGDTESVKVTVDRQKNFQQTVKLSVKAPDKIRAELDRSVVKHGESPDVNVKVTPAADAPAGDHKVTVTATPDTGAATTLDLTIKVVAK